MWGGFSDFSDLAKKAEEAAAAAAAQSSSWQAASSSWSKSAGLFNLDSMQGMSSSPNSSPTHQQENQQKSTTTKHQYANEAISNNDNTQSNPASSQRQGTTITDNKNNNNQSNALTNKKEMNQNTTIQEEAEDDGNGWADDLDDDMDTATESPTTTKAQGETPEAATTTTSATVAPETATTTETNETKPEEKEANENPPRMDDQENDSKRAIPPSDAEIVEETPKSDLGATAPNDATTMDTTSGSVEKETISHMNETTEMEKKTNIGHRENDGDEADLVVIDKPATTADLQPQLQPAGEEMEQPHEQEKDASTATSREIPSVVDHPDADATTATLVPKENQEQHNQFSIQHEEHEEPKVHEKHVEAASVPTESPTNENTIGQTTETLEATESAAPADSDPKTLSTAELPSINNDNSSNVPSTTVGMEGDKATISADKDSREDGENKSKEDAMMAQFSEQLRRLEENHAAEIKEMERRQAQALQDAMKTAAVARSGDQEKQRTLVTQMQQELQKVKRDSHNQQKRIEKLEQEKETLEQQLQSKSKEVGRAGALHKRDLKILQEQLLDREDKASKASKDAQKYQTELEQAKQELSKTTSNHEELLARSKTMAAELKDRRVQCRELSSQLQQATEQKESLSEQVESLQLQLSNQNLTRTETSEQVQTLKAKVTELETQISTMQTQHEAALHKADYALREYKKKAQHELALSNARSAAAVQAKEEAELEARAARTTADSAMDRAVQAELASKQTISHHKALSEEVLAEKERMQTALQKAESERNEAKTNLERLSQQLDQTLTAKEELDRSLAVERNQCQAEAARANSLEEDLNRLQEENTQLSEKVSTLRELLEKQANENKNKASNTTGTTGEDGDAEGNLAKANSTIATLRRELQEANAAIDDLKDALKSSVNNSSSNTTTNGNTDYAKNHNTSSSGLFYAMEKQAELKTAQAEINRLANILADMQNERSEALEAMGTMKERMESAEARLARFKKLAGTPREDDGDETKTNGNEEELDDSNANSQHRDHPTTNHTNSSSKKKNRSADDAATNIEYLKNILLSYLHAKTVTEKKALVPVIAAVLCLTPAEQQAALKQLDREPQPRGGGSGAGGSSATSFFQSWVGGT